MSSILCIDPSFISPLLFHPPHRFQISPSVPPSPPVPNLPSCSTSPFQFLPSHSAHSYCNPSPMSVITLLFHLSLPTPPLVLPLLSCSITLLLFHPSPSVRHFSSVLPLPSCFSTIVSGSCKQWLINVLYGCQVT